MSLVEVKVPQLSESVAEATMLQWKKKPGEAVAIDEILIERVLPSGVSFLSKSFIELSSAFEWRTNTKCLILVKWFKALHLQSKFQYVLLLKLMSDREV